jgi:hypothetical protein
VNISRTHLSSQLDVNVSIRQGVREIARQEVVVALGKQFAQCLVLQTEQLEAG